MNSRWTYLSARYLRLSARNPIPILLCALALAGLGLWLGQRIRVEPSLEALLPADTPALPAIAQMAERIPGSSPLFLLVKSEDPALTRRLARQVRERAAMWPETLYAMDRRDPSYFMDRRLLFLPEQDITELTYQIEDIVDFEECKAVPGCVNLDARPADPSEAQLRDKISSIPEVKALLGLFGTDRLPDTNQPDVAASTEPTGAGAQTEATGRLGDLCNPTGTVCAIQVIVDGSPSDLAFAEHMLARAEALFASVRPPDAPRSLQLATSGRFRNAPMSKQLVVEDLRNTAALSTLLMVLLVFAQFRGGRAFILIFVPLAVAGAWTAGVIALAHPQLNVISAFTLAVLAGLGIDFGVHLLTQYGTERGRGKPLDRALHDTFEKLGGPMGVACVTSACGFGALTAAKFRGFAEMGGLAALGVAFALLAFVTLFAPLVVLCNRWLPERGPLVRHYSIRVPRIRYPRRLCAVIAVGGVVIGLGAAALGSAVSFEYDFKKLTPRLVGHGIRWSEAMHSTTRLATIMMSATPQELERTATALRAEHPERANDAQAWMLTPASFVPPEQQARLAALAKLRTAVERAKKRLSKREQDKLAYIDPLISIQEPITPARLPQWVREWLTERNGSFGTFGLLYSDLRGSDARAMEQLAGQIAELQHRHPETLFASAEALLGLVVPGLRKDAPTMLGLALAGLFLATLLIGRSISKTLTILAPLALGTCLALALMVLLDQKINLYNMLVFPLSFGIGIDGAVYVVWAMVNYGRDTPAELAVTSRGVLGSTLTTAAGFGSMVIANNPGLGSLGALAIITLGCCLVANLVWLPALMYLRYGPKRGARP